MTALLLSLIISVSPDTTKIVYEITYEHETWTERDTVCASFWYKRGRQWYLKGCEGQDYWSDREPRKL